MSFSPLSYLNLNICEILVNATTTPSNLNFHSIIKDTGNSILLVDSQTIQLPANTTFLIKANVSFNKTVSNTTGTSVVLKMTDENSNNLNYQAWGTGVFFDGLSGGSTAASCTSIDFMSILFAQATSRNIRFNLTASLEVSVEKDSANLYTPNSSITILYT